MLLFYFTTPPAPGALLRLYNDALAELGDHPLADLSTTNTRLSELQARWSPAVLYVLALIDWNFARARAVLATSADAASFPPYSYRYARPANYLRKCWLKQQPDDEFQIEHAEASGCFYGFTSVAPLLEYISSAAANLDPANWPPQFARVVTLYLAFLVAPKLARAGDDLTGTLWQKFQQAKAEAERQEAVFLINAHIPATRLPVMRRAIEMLGQQLAGSVSVYSHADRLRYLMNRAWDNTVSYLLAQGAWNFAIKRAVLSDGLAGDDSIAQADVDPIVEGYAVPPAAAKTALSISRSGFTYGFPLPGDFVHKIWLKTDAGNEDEARFQIVRDWVFCDFDPVVLEYVAADDWTTDPRNWPVTFSEAAAARLAATVAPEFMIDQGGDGKAKISQPRVREALEKSFVLKLSDARNKDAIQQFPKTPPVGSFARARRGGLGFRHFGR